MSSHVTTAASLLGLLFLSLILPAIHTAEPAQVSESPASAAASQPAFTLTSPAVRDNCNLPKEYTGDGEAATLPLEWTRVPEGTKSFAVIMHHVAPDKTKWYWILYDIPATTTKLPRNATGIGTLGNNSANSRCEYAPPHSKGPGERIYIYTIYALSASVKLDVKPAEVSRDVLLAAMKNKILDSAELRVVYSRNAPASQATTKVINGAGE